MALIQLADGEVVNFKSFHSGGGGGCDTCGYGGECEIDFYVETSQGDIHLESESCNFDKVMTAILTNLTAFPAMTMAQFKKWITKVWEDASSD